MRTILLSLALLGTLAALPAAAAPTLGSPVIAAMQDATPIVQDVQYRRYERQEFRRRQERRHRQEMRRRAHRRGYYRSY